MRAGDTIRMMATGAEFDVVEVRLSCAPTGMEPTGRAVQPGEVGYIAASIKTVGDTRVGDTVTLVRTARRRSRCPATSKVQPDGVLRHLSRPTARATTDLREALEKLQLNDAALSFEPETSVALGFGFRCGFLGLLHMEIIQERLEREYNLDLITTAPSVVLPDHQDRRRRCCRSTTRPTIPTRQQIALAEEPVVRTRISIRPTEYVGNIMELCQERRGVFKDMKYLDTDRVDMHYELPLNEIIYDFFDALKSRTRGLCVASTTS